MPSIFEWTTATFRFFQNTLGVSPLQVVSKVVEVSEKVVEDLRNPKVGHTPVEATRIPQAAAASPSKKAMRPYADLTGVNLQNAKLQGANLQGANLTSADLTSADLTGARLWGADLTNANLTRARLPGADLRDAKLRDANLMGADLRGATMPDGSIHD